MDRRQQLINRVVQSFETGFGQSPQLIISAPGRVNLIGEHTDYNDGFVLPCAIDHETIVAISPTQGDQVEVIACDYDQHDRFGINSDFEYQTDEWKNHVRGVAASFKARGLKIAGARIAIGGNIPQGAGLSSSASISVALGKAIAAINGFDDIDETQIALIAQQSENDFVGCACGIMDQLASARSVADHAMLLDCRSLDFEPIAIPQELSLLIIHSGVKRGLVDSAYNERREQCEKAARHFGISALRDLDERRLKDGKGDLDDVTYRRARHVVTENQRVLDAARAFRVGDIMALSNLMAASHQSMRDDFEITVPPIDRLVELIANVIGKSGGVRMTGGGFGGCVVTLVPHEKVEAVETAVATEYVTPDGTPAIIYRCKPANGVAIVKN
ncbi:MAG: galactokinase [Parasphingorhabdus sp.]